MMPPDFRPFEIAARRPWRLAFVVHSFNVGGLERCVARLANGLDRNRYQPLIIALGAVGGARDWLETDDVSVFSLGKTRGNDPRLFARLTKLLRDNHVDILHSHNWGTLLECVWSRRRAGVRAHVHAEHGTVLASVEQRGWRHRLRSQAMRWALGQTEGVVAVAEEVVRRIENASGFPRDQIRLIPNGVDCLAGCDSADERQRIRAQLGLAKASVLVGSVGRLAEVKNFEAAIRALASARRTLGDLDLQLVLVGDGPERARLAELAQSLGVARQVHLPGHQPATGPWLAAMDVYINSSFSEGQSLSILEAMAAGLPSVVTEVGDNGRLVGGDPPGGLIVGQGSAEMLASGLSRLAQNPKLRKVLGDAARQRHRERYSLEIMLNAYDLLYTQAVARATAAQGSSVGRD